MFPQKGQQKKGVVDRQGLTLTRVKVCYDSTPRVSKSELNAKSVSLLPGRKLLTNLDS